MKTGEVATVEGRAREGDVPAEIQFWRAGWCFSEPTGTRPGGYRSTADSQAGGTRRMVSEQAAQQLASALSTLQPEGLKALGDAIALMQDEHGHRRSVETTTVASVNLDSVDTAFILIFSSLVPTMTIPGLALFYGGLSQAPNVLATVSSSPFPTSLLNASQTPEVESFFFHSISAYEKQEHKPSH
jgi:hypothetical protein